MGGFTLMEILVVVGIIALLAQVATTGYAAYVARARAADLELAFDQMRTRMAVATRAGSGVDACATLAQQVQAGNTPQSGYAAMDIAFERVTDGFTPMLRICATRDTHGSRGIDVTREAHNLLSRVTTMGKGAVVGDAAVSFAVPLADGAAVCKLAPAAGAPACGQAANAGPGGRKGGG